MNPNILGALLAFIVTAAAAIGVIIGYPMLVTSNQVSQLQSSNNAIYSCIKGAYASQLAFSTTAYGVATTTAAELVVAGCTPSTVNTFGGTITVTGNSSSFYVLQGSVPQAVCTQAMTQASAISGAGTIAVAAGSAAATEVALAAMTNATPVSLGTAAGACEVGGNMLFQMQ